MDLKKQKAATCTALKTVTRYQCRNGTLRKRLKAERRNWFQHKDKFNMIHLMLVVTLFPQKRICVVECPAGSHVWWGPNFDSAKLKLWRQREVNFALLWSSNAVCYLWRGLDEDRQKRY